MLVPGLELIEVYHDGKRGILGLLFDNGVVLTISDEGGVAVTSGTGWEEVWEILIAE